MLLPVTHLLFLLFGDKHLLLQVTLLLFLLFVDKHLFLQVTLLFFCFSVISNCFCELHICFFAVLFSNPIITHARARNLVVVVDGYNSASVLRLFNDLGDRGA